MSREKNKISELLRKSPNMTVAREKNTSDFIAPSSTMRKSPWPNGLDNEATWNSDSRATSASWAEDMEEAGTRKVLDLWKIVEKVLYKEDKEDENLVQGGLMEECIQWRMQIPHFRVIGEKIKIEVVDENGQVCSEKELEELQRRNEETGDDGRSKSTLSKKSRDIRDKIIDKLVDYIMEEVEKNEPTLELNDVLRITPAPTYSGRDTIKSRELINNSASNSSANRVKSFELTERMSNNNNSKAFKKLKNNNAKCKFNNDDNDDDDDDDDNNEDDDDLSSIDTNQLGRNKLGTVFNKKIVVSPMAFAVTTRESFCTLKTTPIKYAGHLLELTTPRGFNRDMSSASKINSAKRSIMFKGPQRHSAWQAPVCPSAWPKNVRLAPIDPSRLSSSKNRSLTSLSPSLPQQRQRNSLSPISRPLKVTSADISTENLEIQGKQITQSAKPNLTKNGWDNSRYQRRKKS